MNLFTLLLPLASFTGLIKSYSGSKVDIDGYVQKIHYRITTGLFFLCAMALSVNDVFGKSLECISSSVPVDVLNLYCWKKTNYTIASKYRFNLLIENGNCFLNLARTFCSQDINHRFIVLVQDSIWIQTYAHFISIRLCKRQNVYISVIIDGHL